MAQRRLQGLQRVLGVNALSSTAYGNVGSSIYYALGLVASFALGLTPVVFVLTGVIFYLTAATYSEATAMFPEAGGSSSFARHAFNEFWSFFAAWGQMLNYTITIAISAFFVPHYIGGLFFPFLKTSPGDIFFGIGVIVAAVRDQRRRRHRGGRRQHPARRHRLRDSVAARARRSVPRVRRRIRYPQRPPRGRSDVEELPRRDPRRDDRLHRDRDDLEHGRGGQGRGENDPAGDQPRRDRRVRDLRRCCRPSRCARCPVRCTPGGNCQTLLGLSEDKGGFAGDPVLGIVKHLHLGALQHAGEIYVGLLAATILFIATNAGIIGVSRLVYSMGLHRQVPDALRRLHPRFRTPWIGIILFGGIACLTLIPGQADFLGNMYAFGAMLSFTIAHLAVIRLRVADPDRKRPYRGPGTVRVRGHDLPLFAIVGGLGTFLAFVTVTLLHLAVAIAGVGWLCYRHRSCTSPTATGRASIS